MTDSNLVFWNTFNDLDALQNSETGPDAIAVGSNLNFESSMFGNGFVRSNRDSHVEIPKEVLVGLEDAGTIEFWITPKHPAPQPYAAGIYGLVGHPYGRYWGIPTTDDTITNISVTWGDTVSGTGIQGTVQWSDTPGMAYATTAEEVPQFVATVGQNYHIAMVWDVNGIDGTTDTVRAYRDGDIVGASSDVWDISNIVYDQYNIWLGYSPDNGGYDRWITDNLKIWDAAKLDFSDRGIEGMHLVGDDGKTLIDGTEGGDLILGMAGQDTLLGNGGDDSIDGGSGKDEIEGGEGNDLLSGGDGRDSMKGGDDNDTLDGDNGHDAMDGGNGDDALTGGSGADTMEGGEGNDTLNGGNGKDVMNGGDDNDTLNGESGKDFMEGGGGNDLLNGGDGRDTMDGGTGDDTLLGESGRDTLIDGEGSDELSGGLGRDCFILVADDTLDTIVDWSDGPDKIDLSAYGIAFEDLVFADVLSGEVHIGVTTDTLAVMDGGIGLLTSADFDAGDFLFS